MRVCVWLASGEWPLESIGSTTPTETQTETSETDCFGPYAELRRRPGTVIKELRSTKQSQRGTSMYFGSNALSPIWAGSQGRTKPNCRGEASLGRHGSGAWSGVGPARRATCVSIPIEQTARRKG